MFASVALLKTNCFHRIALIWGFVSRLACDHDFKWNNANASFSCISRDSCLICKASDVLRDQQNSMHFFTSIDSSIAADLGARYEVDAFKKSKHSFHRLLKTCRPLGINDVTFSIAWCSRLGRLVIHRITADTSVCFISHNRWSHRLLVRCSVVIV